MDREKVNKPSSQIGFIKFVLLPLFEALGTLFPVIQVDFYLVYQPKSLIQSCFVRRRRPASLASASALMSVHTSLRHRVRHRNFIFGIHMLLCPSHMHMKYLVILTCSFYMAAILVICYSHTDSLRDFILHILMYILFIFIHKKNKATITLFLKLMSIFLKFTYSLLLTHVL